MGQHSRRKLSVHVLGAGELAAAANGHAAAAAAAPAAVNGACTETCAAKEAPTEPEAAAAAPAGPAAENAPPASAAAAAAAAPAEAAPPGPRAAMTSPAAQARMARVAADATGQRDGEQHGAPPPENAQGQQRGALKTSSLGNWVGPPGSVAATSAPVAKWEPPAQRAPAGDGSVAEDGQPGQGCGVRAASLGGWGAAQRGTPQQRPEPKSPDGNAAGGGTAMTASAAARMAGIAANTVAQRGGSQGEEETAPALRPPSLGNWAGAPKRTLAAASAPAAAGQRMERRMSLDTVPEQGAEPAERDCV